MYLVGITGPIASGKTSVAKMYKEMGAYLIDADKIGHQLLERPDIKKRIIEEFGDEILTDKGKIDREKLGAIVFSDISRLEALNDIIQKPLVDIIKEQILELQESGFPGIVIVDAALLPKWDIVKLMDLVLVVDAPRWQRMNRLVRQRGLPQDEAERRIEVHEELFKEFFPKQTIVVKNNGDFMELRVQAMRAWLEIKDRMRQKAEKEMK
ncbi:dephospho-CoA kinase [bacterium]|nr:MAG: dephospho-CoA kinase [bacterium]